MEAFFKFLEVLVICIAALIALFLILLALPKSPFRDFVMKFLKPVAITAGAAMIGVDITPLPGIDVIGDVALLAGVLWSWLNFAKEMKAMIEPHLPSANANPFEKR
jgi:hypothetical protein